MITTASRVTWLRQLLEQARRSLGKVHRTHPHGTSVPVKRSQILPFVMLDSDGKEGREIACVFEGIAHVVQLRTGHPDHDKLRETLLNLSYGDAVEVALDDDGSLLSAKVTDQHPECSLMIVIDVDQNGISHTFSPGKLPAIHAAHSHGLENANIALPSRVSQELILTYK